MRFTALYTFPPLYTQKPAARRVFVFFFSEEKKQKTFHWVPCTLAALTRGLVGCRPLNLSLRLGLRPGTMQSLGLPDLNKILVPISGSGDFVLLLAGTLLCAGPFLKTAAPQLRSQLRLAASAAGSAQLSCPRPCGPAPIRGSELAAAFSSRSCAVAMRMAFCDCKQPANRRSSLWFDPPEGGMPRSGRGDSAKRAAGGFRSKTKQ